MISQNLLNRYERDLVLKGFSPRTRSTYYRNLIYFFNHTADDPNRITGEVIKDYLYYLIKTKNFHPHHCDRPEAQLHIFSNRQ